MASNNDVKDFSRLDKKTVCDKLMIAQDNCISVPQMLLKLSGFESDFIFLSDSDIAANLFAKAKEDVKNMKLYEEVLFETSHESIVSEAHLCVVRYKKGKVRKARLAVVGVIKATPFLGMQTDLDELNFLRLVHLPWKRQAGLGDWAAQCRAVQGDLMPHFLRTLDNLEEYVTENGCNIYDLMTHTTKVSLPPLVVKAVTDVVQKVAPKLSSGKGTPKIKTLKRTKGNNRRILDSSSESEDEGVTQKIRRKRVHFSSPLSEVKEYVPESNKRRKLSLKRRRKGPPKELFPPEGRRSPECVADEPQVPTFDLGFQLDDNENDAAQDSFETGDTIVLSEDDISDLEILNVTLAIERGLSSDDAIEVFDDRKGCSEEFPITL